MFGGSQSNASALAEEREYMIAVLEAKRLHKKQQRRSRKCGQKDVQLRESSFAALNPSWGACRYDVRIGEGGGHGKADIVT